MKHFYFRLTKNLKISTRYKNSIQNSADVRMNFVWEKGKIETNNPGKWRKFRKVVAGEGGEGSGKS